MKQVLLSTRTEKRSHVLTSFCKYYQLIKQITAVDVDGCLSICDALLQL